MFKKLSESQKNAGNSTSSACLNPAMKIHLQSNRKKKRHVLYRETKMQVSQQK